jgi:hypothetical protein
LIPDVGALDSEGQNDHSKIRIVAKVMSCAAGDHPEPALQGQVPATTRASGFELQKVKMS